MLDMILGQLTNVLGIIKDLRRDQRELADNALRAISNALNETYLYYHGLESEKERNPDIEAQLSKYWAAAAIPLRHINRELSEICEYKSEYWINPESWDHKKIKQFGIGLNEVRMRYRGLLSPGIKRPNTIKTNPIKEG